MNTLWSTKNIQRIKTTLFDTIAQYTAIYTHYIMYTIVCYIFQRCQQFLSYSVILTLFTSRDGVYVSFS